jgi:hypothetical protein
MKKLLLLLASFTLSIGCDMRDGSIDVSTVQRCDSASLDNLKLTTGITFYDFNGAAIGQYGRANDSTLIDNTFVAYPNPASERISLRSSVNAIEKIWIYQVDCPLNCDDQEVTSDNHNPNLFVGQEDNPLLMNGITIELSEVTQMTIIDLDLLQTGSYRVVVLLDTGGYQWQNIIIHKELDEIPAIIEFIEDECA